MDNRDTWLDYIFLIVNANHNKLPWHLWNCKGIKMCLNRMLDTRLSLLNLYLEVKHIFFLVVHLAKRSTVHFCLSLAKAHPFLRPVYNIMQLRKSETWPMLKVTPSFAVQFRWFHQPSWQHHHINPCTSPRDRMVCKVQGKNKRWRSGKSV